MQLQKVLNCCGCIKLVKGSQDYEVLTISSAQKVTPDSLVFAKSSKFLKQAASSSGNSKFGIIVTDKLWDKKNDIDLEIWNSIGERFTFVATAANFDLAITKVSKLFYDEIYSKVDQFTDGRESGTAKIDGSAKIAPNVFIGENVEIGNNVNIMAGVTIMANSVIGDDSTIYPSSVIYPFSKIGKNCRIHGCSVIGADGFGYNFHGGIHHKIWHFGGVIIGDNVEIGANSCVDTGTFDPTRIDDGVKIDNQVQIGHNTHLSSGVVICGQAGTGGSVKIGAFTVIGGKAGIAQGAVLGEQSQIAGSAMVTEKEFPAKSVLAGHPAQDFKDWLKGIACLRKLTKSEDKRGR